MSTVLVIEDDPRIQKALQRQFSAEGYSVHVVGDGAEGLAACRTIKPVAVILDLMLPGISGRDVCKGIKTQFPEMPVIILSAVSEVADKVLLLELGADDYVTKPFSPRELLARIRTVLRRTKGPALTEARQREVRAYRFVDFELNLRTRRLSRSGQRIELTNGEFNLLAALLAAPQRILTRDQLLESSRVYDNEVYDRSIDVQILRLRRKIEADPSQPQFIMTERGVGYSFSSAVDILY